MKRIIQTSRPDASSHNALLRATRQLGSAIISPGGSAACAGMLVYLQRELIWQPGDFVAICSGQYHQYGVASGSVPTLGLSNGTARVIYDDREAKRYDSLMYRYQNGHDQYQDGWGYYAWDTLTPADYTLSGLDSFRFLTHEAIDGSPPTNPYTGWNAETWSADNGGSRPCEHAPDMYRWYGMSSSPQTSYYTGPHWQCGVTGSGQYTSVPTVLCQNTSGSPPNWIGGMPDPESGHWGWCSLLSIASPTPFGFDGCTWLQSIPDGSIITDAQLETYVSGLQRYQRTNTIAPILDGNGVLTGWDEDYTESSTIEQVSLALIGATVPTGSLRYDYQVLASSVAGIDRSDAWTVVNVTALLQTLIDTYRNHGACRFGLIPAPYADLIGSTDTKELIAALHPTVTLAAHDDPNNANPWMSGNDCWYEAEQSGQYVTWGAVSVGLLAVQWQYPSGELGRCTMPFNFPPMVRDSQVSL